jgi:hypothetical protein
MALPAIPPARNITRTLLLNDLVGVGQKRIWNNQIKRFCGLEVDDRLKPGWRLDR